MTGRVAGGSIGLAVAIQFLTDTCLDSGQTAILLALVSLVLAMLLARTPAPATADEAPSAPPLPGAHWLWSRRARPSFPSSWA